MTNEALLDEVLTEYYDAYLSGFDDVAEHRFSLRHRLKMRKIFKLYEKNVRKLNLKPSVQQHKISKVRFNRKTVLAIVAIVLLSLIAGCAVAYFISESFRGTVHDDNTQLFAINFNNCPETIEYIYRLSNVPAGYNIMEEDKTDTSFYISYLNTSSGETIVLQQWVKSQFAVHYNTENNNLLPISINGCNGILLDLSDNMGAYTVVAWDNGDYIIELSAYMDKNDALNLAKIDKY